MARRRPGRHRYRKKIAPPPGADAPESIDAEGEIEEVPGTPKAVPPTPVRPAPAKPATRQAPSGLARGGKARSAPAAGAGGDPHIGRVIGRCLIEAPIGQGRTSVVYRAHHQALDAPVAVKILLPKAAATPQIVESFETEARAIARIDNENVVKVYDVLREGDVHAIVMELLDGEEVLDIIQREGQLDVMDALRITRQAATGLAAAHQRGIVHRDVKPQNLVLLEDGTVKILDFGLAGAVDAGRVGTPHFMAPETCEDGTASTASDIYSLGITLYHQLIGEPPFAGQDVPSILRSHIRAEPLYPERKRPKLPRGVGDLVRSMTARDPAARPSASEVIGQLDTLGGEAIQEKSGLRRRRSRSRARLAAGRSPNLVLPVAVIAAIALLAFLALRMSKKKPPPPPPIDPTPIESGIKEDSGWSRPDPQIRKEERAKEALAGVETWARKHWKGPDDDESVREEYRAMVQKYFGTEAATEADTRARMIARGEMHAHPDHTLLSAEDVAKERAVWAEAALEVEAAIAEHLYLQALQRLPADDAILDGTLKADVAFYRSLLEDLLRFQSLMARLVPGLGLTKRVLATEDGMGPVTRVTDEAIEIDVDGKKVSVPWARVRPFDLIRLGRRALQGATAAEKLTLLTFAFAHREEDGFWEARLDLPLEALPPAEQRRVEAMDAALSARMAEGSD